jgi:hypothetical protein
MERAMVGFAKQEVLLYGFNSGTAYVRPAANLRLAGPQLRVTSDEVVGNERRISAELQAARENLFTGIGFAPNSPVLRVLVEGQPALVNSSVAPRRLLRVFGMGQRPIHVEIVARAGQKLPLTVLDVAQLGQNPEATQLEASREQTAVPTQLGDHSVVFSQVQL